MPFNVDLYLETLRKKYGTYKSPIADDSSQSIVQNNASRYKQGDTLKNVLGTTAEFEQNFVNGLVLNPLEGIIDFGASIVGNVASWFGQENFKKDVENFIKHDYSADAWDNFLKYADPVSMVGMALDNDFSSENNIGDYSALQYLDKNAQDIVTGVETGLGQVTGLVALGATMPNPNAAKIASDISIFTGAAGSGVEQSLYEGKDLGTATLYGTLSGGVELFTEKIFGSALEKVWGSSIADKGINKIIGVFVKGNSRKATIAKNIIKIALESFGEGAEEVLSDIMDNYISRPLAQMKSKGIDIEDLGQDFLVGFLTSAISMALGGSSQAQQIYNNYSTAIQNIDSSNSNYTRTIIEDANQKNEPYWNDFFLTQNNNETSTNELFNAESNDFENNTRINNTENFIAEQGNNYYEKYLLQQYLDSPIGSIEEQNNYNNLPDNLKEKVSEFKYPSNEKSDAKNFENKITAVISPSRNNNITDATYLKERQKVIRTFTENGKEICKKLNIEEGTIINTIGGYDFDDGTHVDEVSFQFVFSNVKEEKVKLFTLLMADLGYEVQDSSFYYNYVDENSKNYNGAEYAIKVKETKGLIELLKDVGITEYTIDVDHNFIKIFEFNDYKNPNSETKNKIISLIKALGENYNGSESTKVNSTYVDKYARRSTYGAWLSNVDSQKTKSGGIRGNVSQEGFANIQSFSEAELELIRKAYERLDKFIKSQSNEKNTKNEIVENNKSSENNDENTSKVAENALPKVSFDTILKEAYPDKYYTLSQKYNGLSYYTKSDVKKFVSLTKSMISTILNNNENLELRYDSDYISATIYFDSAKISENSIYEKIKQKSTGKNLNLEESEIESLSEEISSQIMNSTYILYDTDTNQKARLSLEDILTDKAYTTAQEEIKNSISDLLTNSSKDNSKVKSLYEKINHLKNLIIEEKGKQKTLKNKAKQLIQLEREERTIKNVFKYNSNSNKVGQRMPSHFEKAFKTIFNDLGRIVSSTRLEVIESKKTRKDGVKPVKNIRGRLLEYKNNFYNEKNFQELNLIYDETIGGYLDEITDSSKENQNLSVDEIKMFRDILRNLRHMYETSHQIFLDGKKVNIQETGEKIKERTKLLLSKRKGYGTQKKRNPVMKLFHYLTQASISPDTVIESFDLGIENGELNQMITQTIFKGEKQANEMLREIVEFKDENFTKNDLKKMAKEVEIKINEKKFKMDIGTAIEIYTELKRDWALEHYKTTKSMEYEYNGVSYTIDEYYPDISSIIENAIGKEYAEKMSQNILELFKITRKYKVITDNTIFGFSNALSEDDNYYYIRTTESSRRSDVTGGNLNQMMNSMVRGFGFNKNTISAKGILKIQNTFDTISQYITNMYRYVAYAEALDNANRFLNYNLGTTTNPDYIWNFYEKNVDANFKKYLTEYFMNIQGIYQHKTNDTLTRWLGIIRSNFSKAALYANLNVVLQQPSAIPMFYNYVSAKNLVKGTAMAVAHPKRSMDRMIKNSAIAFQRYQGNNVADAQVLATVDSKKTFLGKSLDKLGVLIGYMDEFSCAAGYNACLLETNGDEAKAIELFDKAVRETQPATTTSGASALRRGAIGGEIGKMISMFSSQTQQNTSLIISAIQEYVASQNLLEIAKRNDSNNAIGVTIEECETRVNKAKKKLRKSFVSLTAQATLVTLIAMALKALMGKEEDASVEGRARTFFLGMFDNTIGSMNPLFQMVSNTFLSGYDFRINTVSAISDFVDATKELFNYMQDIIEGKDINHLSRLASILRGMSYVLGLPLNNVAKYSLWITSWFNPELALQFNNVLYGVSSSSSAKKLNEYIDSNNEDLAKSELSYLMSYYKTGSVTDKTRDEIYRLYKEKYNVLPSSITKSITIENVEYDMTDGNRKKKFMNVYSGANPAIEKVLDNYLYRNLTDDSKAYVFRKVYDTFYNLAKSAISNGEYTPEGKFNAIARILGKDKKGYEQISTLVLYLAKINEIEGKNTDERRKKVEKFINSLSLSKEMKYLLYCVAGYAIPDSQKKNIERYLKSKNVDSETIEYLMS